MPQALKSPVERHTGYFWAKAALIQGSKRQEGKHTARNPSKRKEATAALLLMLNKVYKRNISCPAILWCHLWEGSKWNLSRLPCSPLSWTWVWRLCFSFTSVEPAPSSAFCSQMEELMQLDCCRASSGTTSNDITSICDAHHQPCSHLRQTANRRLSRLAGKRGAECPPLPTPHSQAATGL